MITKFLKLGLILSMTTLTTTTFAQQHTVSLGYAQSEIENAFDIRGVHAQYRYELETPLSVMATMSYQTGDETWIEPGERQDTDVKHFSLLAGPAYRLNENFSVYGVVGIAHSKVESSYRALNIYENMDLSETAFAYGVGININPVPQYAINIGYEGTKVDGAKFDGFNISAGYRF